jgi:hypothetical protein
VVMASTTMAIMKQIAQTQTVPQLLNALETPGTPGTPMVMDIQTMKTATHTIPM